MSNYSKLKVYEPLESLENSNYWKVYVEAEEKFWKEFGEFDSYGGRCMSNEDMKKCEQYILKTSKIEIVDCELGEPTPLNVAVRCNKGTDKESISIPQGLHIIEGGKTYVSPYSGHGFYSRNEVPIVWFLLFRDADRDFYPGSNLLRECDIQYKRRLKDALDECEDRLRVLKGWSLMKWLHWEGQELLKRLSICDKAGYVMLFYSDAAQLFTREELENDHSAAYMEGLISDLKNGLASEAMVEMKKLEAINHKGLNVFAEAMERMGHPSGKKVEENVNGPKHHDPPLWTRGIVRDEEAVWTKVIRE